MRLVSSLLLVVVLLGLFVPAAQAEERPFNLTLFNPVQVFDETVDVTGVRLNVLYGRNANVKGLDVGFVAGHATGNFTGVQWHPVNLVDGDFTGWQTGWLFSQTRGEFYGLQSSAVNVGQSRTEGVQFGLVNMTENMHGLQIGLVNITDQMYGLQIGLVNVIKVKDSFPVLPLVNWRF